ncbi:hypothetical protein ZWY2020_055403 [Hordeum vulgare]|nr:hypothetical protein ZWY2020_055403 [Hordeum vulgare]
MSLRGIPPPVLGGESKSPTEFRWKSKSSPPRFCRGRKDRSYVDVGNKESEEGELLVNVPARRKIPIQIEPCEFRLLGNNYTPDSQARSPSMSSTGDGGEKGGAGEAPTHPKSPGTDEMVPKRDRRDQIALLEEIDNTSNWDERASMGLDGPDVRVDGVVDFDDDVVAEEEPEAEEGAAPPRWRLLGRYVSLGRPNVDDMTEHFSKVWKVRTGLNIARIKNNWYAITFFSEGDHKFVARGGPWIYKGNALTVGPFRAGEQMSEAELNSVPVWVRAYNVPWDKQTIAYGAFLGGLLGKTMEVDAEADGSRVPEFLHIRIDLSLSRRLQTKITVGREPAKQVIYPLRYERVPHYCFWCGFIGHDDNLCEKKRLGVPTRAYDEGLRCSPYRKYENRSAFVASGAQTAAKRGLNFVSNAPSEVLGQPRESHRGRRNQQQQQTRDIPVRVDARDGFGERYSGAGTNVDADLADRVKSMCVHLDGQKTMISHGRCNRATSEPPEFVFLGGRVPNPLPFSVHPGSSTSHSSRLGSSDMILAIRGLGNSMEFSQSDSDQHMQEADSVLGKRFMRGISGEEVSSGEGGEEPDGKKPVGSKQKRGKLLYLENGQGSEQKAENTTMVGNMESTSQGAAGKLTGSEEPPRQGP